MALVRSVAANARETRFSSTAIPQVMSSQRYNSIITTTFVSPMHRRQGNGLMYSTEVFRFVSPCKIERNQPDERPVKKTKNECVFQRYVTQSQSTETTKTLTDPKIGRCLADVLIALERCLLHFWRPFTFIFQKPI